MSGFLARPGIILILGLWFGLANGCVNCETKACRSTLSVFAASSLTEAFQELERMFEAAHRNIDVKLTFAGSQILRLQLEHGADADIFASANELHMRALIDGGVVSGSKVFAYNELVVIVPKSNPASIAVFEDLNRATRLVIGTDNVPVGIYTRRVFDRAAIRFGEEFISQVRSHVVSEESNVRLVRAKVELGEADAAVVYRTDAVSSERLSAVAIPSELNVRASYPIGVVTGSAHAEAARQFIEFVLSEQGQATLVQSGFVSVAP